MLYHEFSRINRQRSEHPTGFGHDLDSWSPAEWVMAFVGEFGEMCNVLKKIMRYRDGVRGNREEETVAALKTKARQELGDAGVYLDLLAQRLGFNLFDAMLEVFQSKSEEIGYKPPKPEDENGSG
jgi:NTP pyrophosphatase (non-canonical NTP hydrolase)